MNNQYLGLSKMVTHMVGKYGTVDKNGVQNYPRVDAVVRRLVSTVEPLGMLEDIIRKKNPVETDQAHLKRISQAAVKMRKAIDRDNIDVRNLVSDGYSRINEAIEKECNLVPSENAVEIRNVLRSMTSEARNKAISEAIESGDSEIISAIKHGNALTTGMPKQQVSQIVSAYTAKVAPQLLDETKALDEVFESAKLIINHMVTAADTYEKQHEVARILEAEEAAKASQDEFNSAVGHVN